MWCYTNQNRISEDEAFLNTVEQLSQKPRLGRKNVKQGVCVGAEAVQLIDASRKKYDAGLRRTSGVRYVTSDPIGLLGGVNTYGYANANSLKYYDPDGQLAFLGVLPFIGGSGGSFAGGGSLAGFASTLLGGVLFAGMLTIPGDVPDDDAEPKECPADNPDCNEHFTLCLGSSMADLEGSVYGSSRCGLCRDQCVRNGGIWPDIAIAGSGAKRCDYWNF